MPAATPSAIISPNDAPPIAAESNGSVYGTCTNTAQFAMRATKNIPMTPRPLLASRMSTTAESRLPRTRVRSITMSAPNTATPISRYFTSMR